jgi:hypothetical protein
MSATSCRRRRIGRIEKILLARMRPFLPDDFPGVLPRHTRRQAVADAWLAATGPEEGPVISVLAGAHPDEPAGPVAAVELLRHWSTYPWGKDWQLITVPMQDPSGVEAQRAWLTASIKPNQWQADDDLYRSHRLRRSLGIDDGEFAWPGAPWGGLQLPVTTAIDAYLRLLPPALVHASLHGLGIAPGMWFLADRQTLSLPVMWQRVQHWQRRYGIFDDQRCGGQYGKGFHRAGNGFSHLSTGLGMRWWQLAQQDAVVSSRGAGSSRIALADHEVPMPGYGSWEAARARNRARGAPAPYGLVTEFPLFLAKNPTGSLTASNDVMAVPLAQQVASIVDLVTTLLDQRWQLWQAEVSSDSSGRDNFLSGFFKNSV